MHGGGHLGRAVPDCDHRVHGNKVTEGSDAVDFTSSQCYSVGSHATSTGSCGYIKPWMDIPLRGEEGRGGGGMLLARDAEQDAYSTSTCVLQQRGEWACVVRHAGQCPLHQDFRVLAGLRYRFAKVPHWSGFMIFVDSDKEVKASRGRPTDAKSAVTFPVESTGFD